MSLLHFNRENSLAISEQPDFPEDFPNGADLPDNVFVELQELTTYYLKFYESPIPTFLQKSINTLGKPYGKIGNQIFELSFRHRVGLTRIGPLRLHINNTKIPDKLYHNMLDYLTTQVASLVFNSGNAVGQNVGKGASGQDTPYINYLFIRNYLLRQTPDLKAIGHLIMSNPHQKLVTESIPVDVDKVSYLGPAEVLSLFSAVGNFAEISPSSPAARTALGQILYSKTKRHLFPSQVINQRKFFTHDTNENRFIKFFLKYLEELLSKVNNLPESYLNPELGTDTDYLKKYLHFIMSASLWSEVGNMTFLPANSQVLQKRDGYKQLFRLWSLLQLSTQCLEALDFKNLIETKDTTVLFEYWSFFVILELLKKDRKTDFVGNYYHEPNSDRLLRPSITITFDDGAKLHYNRTCSGTKAFKPEDLIQPDSNQSQSYSFEYCPDIVIEKNGSLLVFDAKYKGQGGGFYGEDEKGGIATPKSDDIGKMHTYREAIRDVFGAFILYPGQEAQCFTAHGAEHRFQGVGALPLRPANSGGPDPEHVSNIEVVIDNFLSFVSG